MTIKQIEALKKLKIGDLFTIGNVSIKRDRGQYNVTCGKFIKTFKEEEFNLMSQKIDELSTVVEKVRLTFEIPGTKLIVLKSGTGYDVYENGKILQKGIAEKELDAYVERYKNEQNEKKVETIRKEVVNEYRMSRQKKVLYYFILVLSVILLGATYILGLKFDGVSVTRTNQALYEVIRDLAEEKYPEKKNDKFDAVYYTLNYFAHSKNYFMTDTVLLLSDGTETTIRLMNSHIYQHYLENELVMDMTDDYSYSGFEFNAMFKNIDGKYVSKAEIIRRIGFILGYADVATINDLATKYKAWDQYEVKSNRAYNWELVNIDGSTSFDRNSTYYTTYLSRNPFIKLFLNDASKFIHEYHMFESVGWLTWTSLGILILYLLLAFSIWVFKKDNLKISSGLIRLIIILSVFVIVPLILQYFFEGLSKNATEFLDIIENTRFTTTTTFMNLLFDYIVKFSSIVLTGVLTIALPLKVVRYFVFNSISKLDKDRRLERVIAAGTTLSENLDTVGWRGL